MAMTMLKAKPWSSVMNGLRVGRVAGGKPANNYPDALRVPASRPNYAGWRHLRRCAQVRGAIDS
jgi:hypothetical protein